MSIKAYIDSDIVSPWGECIPSNAKSYLRKNNLIVRFWRRLKRDLLLLLTGQLFFRSVKIPSQAKKILYVYLGTPQLGDSIMDLSARVLWAEKGLQVDMFTHENLALIYKGDPSFSSIIYDPSELSDEYDCIVLQSYSSKCMRFKLRYFYATNFLSLHGYYYGCDFNRLEFADRAWRHVLGLGANVGAKFIEPIFNCNSNRVIEGRSKNTIAVAIGGVVERRTYPNWGEVIRLVNLQVPNFDWILLGASNGCDDANSIFNSLKQELSIVNHVGEIALDKVFEKLQNVTLLVTADGGLLHMGRAAECPIVGLFAGEIHPRMRFAWGDPAHVIHAQDEVANIEPYKVAASVVERLQDLTAALKVNYLDEEPECSCL